MAVTVTNKYASSTAGGRSQDVVVSQGEVVTMFAYSSDFSDLPANLQIQVQRKIGAANYRQVPDSKDLPGMITSATGEVTITAPGTYALLVPPTSKAVTVDEVR